MLYDIARHKAAFALLERVMFRDIILNGLYIRILGIYYMDHDASWTVKSHKHSFYELHYVTGYDVHTTLNGNEFHIREGSFYLMPPGTIHSHCQKNHCGHTGFAIRWELLKGNRDGCFEPGKLDYREVRDMTDFLSHVSLQIIEDDGKVLNGMLGLLEAAEKGQPDLCLKLALLKLVADVAERCPGTVPAAGTEAAKGISDRSVDNNRVNTAVRFIEENYNQDIDVNDVAESAFLSYSHLSRIFKTITGESVNGYINKTRILKAQYLLKCTDMAVAAVAAETGFKSENYFCDSFKKAVGISPLAYKKNSSKFNE